MQILKYLMVDVVANHMAYDSTAETVDYSQLNPFNEASYFHDICWIEDYNNQTQLELVRLRNISGSPPLYSDVD